MSSRNTRAKKRSHKPSSSRDHSAASKHPHRSTKDRQQKSALKGSSTDLPCPIFGRCGGCDLLDIAYDIQLQEKQSQIESLFCEMARKDAFRKIKGMDEPFHYRDKVISPFVSGAKTPTGKRQILTGMYERGTHRVIETECCLMENEIAQRIIREIKHLMSKHNIEPYDEDSGKGFMRHAAIRVGHESGEILVTLVTNDREFAHSKSFCRKLVDKVPEITTVVQNINTRQTNVILGDEEKVLYGPGFILDTLCSLSFRVSSHSFYQVNSKQTEVLYRSAMELAHPQDGGTFIDAYCGTGTIGLVAASMGASQVIGVDSVASSIRDARMNAKHNGIENAEFQCADATEFLQRVAAEGGLSDDLTMLMDPPRAGSTPEFLESVARMHPKRVVYISCNPSTQARDVATLLKAGYEIEAIQPVDMFPHTRHIENIVTMVPKV